MERACPFIKDSLCGLGVYWQLITLQTQYMWLLVTSLGTLEKSDPACAPISASVEWEQHLHSHSNRDFLELL